MEETILLSVIMPVFNAEPYVEKAIRSVLAQSFQNMELICVDDASTDGSFHVIQKLAQADPRVVAVRSEKNVGAGQARNKGISLAKGDYITFMDSDDTIEPRLYEKVCEIIRREKADEVVWGLTEERYDAKDRLIRSVPISPGDTRCKTSQEKWKTVLRLERDTLFGYQWNSAYRAAVIAENHIRFPDSLLYEDYFFNLEFIKHAKTLATLDDTGYHYYKRVNGSITNRFVKEYFELSYRRVETLYDFCCLEKEPDAEDCNVLANKLLRYTLSALCRHHNPLSGMDKKARKQWFITICDLPLYAQLLPRSGRQNLLFRILKHAVMKKRAFPALFMGKILSFLI